MTLASSQACLLTVVFPVFDVRGDIVERVRRWTEEQDFDQHRYSVFVVAGPEPEFDEARLRKVLRSQDVFVRLSVTGRDADYWNEGARQTTTPWLLFVEAHGLPARDSLSALASWIDANPNSSACNFTVQSRSDHRVTRLLKRWFAETHAAWVDQATWPRIHRTACAIRRDAFEEVGPFEPAYGQFAPPLLSAHMHRRGRHISTLPASKIVHEDMPEMAPHHEDTADYARGEADARAANDPAFFEKYFGPSPFQEGSLSPRRARAAISNVVRAALRRPGRAVGLLRSGLPFLPTAMLEPSSRARFLAALTRLDEHAVMYAPLPKSLQWKRFLLAHRRVVRVEQLRWSVRNPPAVLRISEAPARLPIDEVDQRAIVGAHALEYLNGAPFRWTRPAFLLRCSFAGSVVITLETQGLRGRIDPSVVSVVAGGRIVKDIAIDARGNIGFSLRHDPDQAVESDIFVITAELREPSTGNIAGRRLGLPLFSVSLQRSLP